MQRKKLKKIIVSIVCLLFIFSLLILYVNFHFHVINNNLLVSHSHPFDKNHDSKSPLKSHPHTSVEFLIYSSLINFDGIIFLLFFLIILSIAINFLSNKKNSFRYNNSAFLLPILRAPPLVDCSK